MIAAIITFFGIGRLRPAPGTMGSVAAVLSAVALFHAASLLMFVCATCAIFVIGLWATAQHEKTSTDHDPSYVVIDEVYGQWVALWPVHYFGLMQFENFWQSPLAIMAAFLLFRLFDIVKIGPVGWFDQRRDALGVMMDDGVAGGIAALILTLIFIYMGL